MNEELFWEIINYLDWEKLGDNKGVVALAVRKLAELEVEDIFLFHEILSHKLYLLDTLEHARNIGDDSYNGKDEDFSADNFLYVRCAVVANGKDVYEYILANPEEMPKNGDFEPLLYLPMNAIALKTGEGYYYSTEISCETFSNKEGWKI